MAKAAIQSGVAEYKQCHKKYYEFQRSSLLQTRPFKSRLFLKEINGIMVSDSQIDRIKNIKLGVCIMKRKCERKKKNKVV